MTYLSINLVMDMACHSAYRKRYGRPGQAARRAGALRSWANTSDKTARTQSARDKFLRKFEIEVDPGGILPEKERAARALYARRAYMTELARKSARIRRDKAGARKGHHDVAAEDDGSAVISRDFRDRASASGRDGQQQAS
jgi:hypothetical protein